MKACSKCKVEKPISAFYKADWCAGGVRPDCKECNKGSRANRHQHAKTHNPLQRRSVVLKNKYGITQADFEKMFADQEGKCKLCGTPDPGPKGVFAVDHCHKTSKIRGLLCYLCNIGLGSFRDRPDLLIAAASYLEKNN